MMITHTTDFQSKWCRRNDVFFNLDSSVKSLSKLIWWSDRDIVWIDVMLLGETLTCGWQPTTMKMNTPWRQLRMSVTYHSSCGPPTAHDSTSAIHVTPMTTTSFMHTLPRAALKQKFTYFSAYKNHTLRKLSQVSEIFLYILITSVLLILLLIPSVHSFSAPNTSTFKKKKKKEILKYFLTTLHY